MFGSRYFASSFWGPHYWGRGAAAPAAARPYWGPRHFGARYFGRRYFPGGTAATPTVTPLSVQGAILARFLATPALVAAIPGGLEPVHAGKPAMPYATIVHVGGTYAHQSGAEGVHIREDQFLITTYGGKDALEAAKDELMATFNHLAIGAAPLPMRRGSVFAVDLTSEYMTPGAEPDMANRSAYRQVLRFTARTQRTIF